MFAVGNACTGHRITALGVIFPLDGDKQTSLDGGNAVLRLENPRQPLCVGGGPAWGRNVFCLALPSPEGTPPDGLQAWGVCPLERQFQAESFGFPPV